MKISSHKLCGNSSSKVSSIDHEKVFFEADDYFESLIDDINHAKFSIKIESYIFEYQYLGREIIKALIQASRSGVRCYLMIDGIGSSKISARQIKKWEDLGIEVKVFHPLPWQINFKLNKIVTQLMRLFISLYSINKRNHRKMAIIDNKISYVGSFNISDDHLKKIKAHHAWKDCGVRIMGSRVSTLHKAFRYTWKRPFDPYIVGLTTVYVSSKRLKQHLVRLNYSLKWRVYFNRDLLEKIRDAKEKIWITNPYFVPDISILNQLKKASKKGVDIRVLVPKKSDMKLFPYINSLFYRNLIKAGIRVFEYKPRVLHAKSIIIDDWIILGSSNLNSRSHRHDLEVDIVLDKNDQKEMIIEHYKNNLSMAEELAYDDVLKRYRYDYFKTPIIRLIKYWL